VSTIGDTHAQPLPDNYHVQCNNPNGDGCYLDDPYEGELMVFFMTLFSEWTSEQERDAIWQNKRAKLVSVEYPTPWGNITVQRGYWFSAHEQWKFMVLPYMSVDPARRVFVNGERMRTINSMLKGVPGLYASVNDVTADPMYPAPPPPPGYISATGIAAVAVQPVLRQDVVTPYASFPVMLANLPTGLLWYNTMLKAGKMQNPYGSTESIAVNGTMICPLLTWDAKITSVLAMLGGMGEITEGYLHQDGLWDTFHSIVDREYSRAFPVLHGEALPFGLPKSAGPTNLVDFTNCRCDS
jgi:hypothetical protein